MNRSTRNGKSLSSNAFRRFPTRQPRSGVANTTESKSDVDRDFSLTREPQVQAVGPGKCRSSNDRMVLRCSAVTSVEDVIPKYHRSRFGKGQWRLK